MIDEDVLGEASKRLDRALETMEKMVAERRQSGLKAETLEEQLQSLNADLSVARARADRLSEVNEEVSGRLETVINTVRTMTAAS
jgi:hypothetical protein